MALGHEKLDLFRLAIGYIAWVFDPDFDGDFDATNSQQDNPGNGFAVVWPLTVVHRVAVDDRLV